MRIAHYLHQIETPPAVVEPVLTDPESVRAALRRLQSWMPIGRPCIGTISEHAIYTLMAFASEHVEEEES